MQGGSALLAADMIFSDGLESTTTASTQVMAALNEELQDRTACIAALRSRQLAVLGGGAGLILLLMIGLALQLGTEAANRPSRKRAVGAGRSSRSDSKRRCPRPGRP